MERSVRGYLFKIKEAITKTKLLYCVLVVFFLSCLNDPLSIDGSDSHIINKEVFLIDSELSHSIVDDSLIYNSPLLYTGYINQDIGSSYSVISLVEREDFLSQICSIESIEAVDLILNATSELKDTSMNQVNIQDDVLSVLFQSGEIDLYDDVYNDVNDLSLSSYNLVGSKLEVDLIDESNIFNQICDDSSDKNFAFNIMYDIDSEEQDESFIEFNSTNSFDSSLKPSIRVSYMSPDTVLSNRYFISPDSHTLGEKISGSMYFSNPSNNDQADSIYVAVSDLVNSVLDEEFNFSEISGGIYPVLSSEDTGKEVILGSIHLSFPEDLLGYEPLSTDTILITIDDIVAYNYLEDPSNDNWDPEQNPDGTDGNNEYDEAEIWEDIGSDACPDSLEVGDVALSCANSILDSPYNVEGTEGNNLLDWEDIDGDGLWTDSSEGERWYDCGVDMECNDEDITDDYNSDPSNDNYSVDNNPEGTEGNNQYNFGEPYFDIGPDGIENSNDIGEEDGFFQLGEPFLDTGDDGKFDYDEDGYNIAGTEGNGKYDFGEVFDDCGIDNDCDDGDDSDNYNGDPNNDNYSADNNPEGTEGDNQYNEGEPWTDYGVDGLSDEQEVFNVQNNSNQFQKIDLEFIINEAGNINLSPELDSPGLRISGVSGSLNQGIDLQLSIFSEENIAGLQFVVRHNPKSFETSTLATEYHLKYLDDKSFYSSETFFNSNNITIDDSGSKISDNLLQSSGYGVKTILTFKDSFNNDFFDRSLEKSSLVLHISSNSSIDEGGVWVWPQSMNTDTFLTPYLIDELDTLIQIDISSAINEYKSLEIEDPFQVVLYSPGITNNFSYIFYDTNKKPNIQLYYE